MILQKDAQGTAGGACSVSLIEKAVPIMIKKGQYIDGFG
jgi:hypothetical protein